MTHSDGNAGRERDRSGASLLMALGIPAAVALIVFALLLTTKESAEAALADLANWLPVGYAFAAGMVASINPCGFFMLPSYISYHLGSQEEDYYRTSAWRRAGQALLLGATATLGFIIVFGLTGLVIAAGGRWIVAVFPYAGLLIGILMAGLGVWLLISHANLGLMAASRLTVSPQRNLQNVFLFGLVYALGSLSCTLPIFLVVVGSALASQSLWISFGQFLSFALGMGTVLLIVTLGAALFRGVVARRLRQGIPYVHRISALFLLGAGLYLVYYWINALEILS